MNQPGRNGDERHFVPVQAPHSYDGIGQALRSIYRNDRDPPDAIASALRQLETLD